MQERNAAGDNAENLRHRAIEALSSAAMKERNLVDADREIQES
jgi:hypothetical protein